MDLQNVQAFDQGEEGTLETVFGWSSAALYRS